MSRWNSGPAVWRIQVGKTQQSVAEHAIFARTLGARLRGLVGRDALPDGHALIFPRCGSIHTLGMRFPIDVIFVDRQWRVVSLRVGVRPWRVVWPVLGAWGVVEVAAGTVQRLRVKAGDTLTLTSTP